MNRVLCVLALAVLSGTAAFAQDDVITISGWRIHAGDDASWARPEYDDSHWEETAAPLEHTSRDPVFFSGYRWYRATAAVPDWPVSRALAIGMTPLDEVYEIYVEGVSVGRSGQWEPRPVGGFTKHVAYSLPAGLVRGPLVHVAIRQWRGVTFVNRHEFASYGTSITHAPRMGSAALIAADERLDTAESAIVHLPFIVVTSLLCCGLALLALVLFNGDRGRREYLWLGLSAVLYGAPPLGGLLLSEHAGVPVRSALPALLVVGYIVRAAFLCLFLARLCPRLRWLLRAGAAFQVLAAGCAYFSIVYQFLPAQPIYWDGSPWVEVAVQLAVTVALAFERRADSQLLAVAALAPTLAIAWYWGAVRIFGGWSGRLFYPGGLRMDIRDVAECLFIATTLAVLYRRYQKEQARRLVLDQDLASARRVQEMLLGSGDGPMPIPGFAIGAVCRPAREVGGDFYQVMPNADGRLLVIVGDVSGKGLEAAMLASTVVGAIRSSYPSSPGELLARLNRAIRGRTHGGFVTCCCALFEDGCVRIASAGHPSPYASGKEIAGQADLPLGIMEVGSWGESEYRLSVGEQLTMVSDGVVEAANAEGELFGFERTRGLSTTTAEAIAEAACTWGQNDDITVVTVRRTA